MRCSHYENHNKNLPMQYTDFSYVVKIDFFFQFFFPQNIDCRRGGSNEYPQSMFWSKNKKNRYTPENPSFSI